MRENRVNSSGRNKNATVRLVGLRVSPCFTEFFLRVRVYHHTKGVSPYVEIVVDFQGLNKNSSTRIFFCQVPLRF